MYIVKQDRQVKGTAEQNEAGEFLINLVTEHLNPAEMAQIERYLEIILNLANTALDVLGLL
jgi:hypothetical protein